MIVRFHPLALKELSAAIAYYREISKTLAQRLLLAVEDARGKIVKFPEAWPPGPSNTRHFLLSGFPYRVVYRICGGEIQIIALAHYKRKTGYWRRRAR
jgi:toxin ParE1/3/4